MTKLIGTLVLMILMIYGQSALAETTVEFIGNKVVVEQNGVVTEVTIDKEDLLMGDSDEIVRKVLKKLEEE